MSIKLCCGWFCSRFFLWNKYAARSEATFELTNAYECRRCVREWRRGIGIWGCYCTLNAWLYSIKKHPQYFAGYVNSSTPYLLYLPLPLWCTQLRRIYARPSAQDYFQFQIKTTGILINYKSTVKHCFPGYGETLFFRKCQNGNKLCQFWTDQPIKYSAWRNKWHKTIMLAVKWL